MITGISAVLIVKNEEKVLEDCLRSLERFEEVVIFFNHTTDSSPEIAGRFANVTVTTGPFLGFGPTRNEAARLASNNWLFVIDADERCSPELIDNLTQFKGLVGDHPAALVERLFFFMGKKFEAKNWPRLYQRDKCRFDKMVHEEIVMLDGTSLHKETRPVIGGSLTQLTPDVKRQFAKARHYAQLAADAGKKRRSVPVAFLLSFHKFVLWYLFRLGFLKGKAGFLYACQVYYVTYAKYTIAPSKGEGANF